MKLYIIILTLLFVGVEYAQLSTPKAWTTNYGFRQYAQGANAGADSINQNWIDIDTKIKMVYDSAQAKGSKLASNTWTGSNTFSGTTVLNATTTTSKRINPITNDSYSLGSNTLLWRDVWATQMHSGIYVIYNQELNDSVYITLDDSTVTFDKNVSFTASTLLPSASGKLGDDTTAFAKVYADTVLSGESQLVLQGKQGGVNIYGSFGLSAPTSRAINAATTTIDCTDLSYILTSESEACPLVATLTAGSNRKAGSILTVINSSNFNVTLKNGTGNMILGADLVLGQYDNATFIYYDIGGSSYRWLCIGNRNN